MTVRAVVGAAAPPPLRGGSSPPSTARSTSYETALREARAIVAALVGERPAVPTDRCRLCGEPSFGAYCAGHSWAYGEPQA